jgi:hypothetical protein
MTEPSGAPAAGSDGTRRHDFDLHGIVGIRLLDATPRDVATVRRQLGPIESPLGREPDITVRFVDELESGPLTLVGIGDSGFDEDSFFLLSGRGGAEGRARVPFDRMGRGIELTCERRLTAVPHLIAMINLAALAKGVLPLHATAFTSGSTGVLVTGWSKGGKTEALLACMSEGATYVGDEWVYLTDDGRMLGLPEPIRLWSWQLDQMPTLLRSRPARERAKLTVWSGVASLAARAARSRLPGSPLVRRAQPALGRQAYLQIPPADLFGPDKVSLEGRLDAVVLVMSHEDPRTVTRPTYPGEVVQRMLASLQEERSALLTHYRHFRYAFPDRDNPVLDNAGELDAKLLSAVLDGRGSVAVLHPHPCDIQLLGRAVMAGVESALRADAGPAVD